MTAGQAPALSRPAAGTAVLDVLGAPRLVVDGRVVSLGGPVPQAVLAVLVCAHGEPVPVDRLLREVWPSADSLPSRKTLAAHVSRLRKVLPAATSIEHGAQGYRLSPHLRTDVQRFVELVTEGRARRGAGDPQGARASYVEALALWRGEPCAGVDAETVAVERARLSELVLTAREDLAEVRLALDEPVRVLEDLAGPAGADPPRERALAAYATALHRTGRRTEALAAVRRGQQALRAVGADSTVLAGLEQALLRDAVPTPDDARRAPAARSDRHGAPQPPPLAIPLPVSSFVGRAELLAETEQRLEQARLLTLVGPGGVGKSRMVLELLRTRSAASVALAPLAPLTDGSLVAAVVGDVLVIPESAGSDVAGSVAAAIGNRPLLLVLDNAEHVRDAVGAFVARLLAACPAVRVLVTSREPCGVPGEHVLEVPPLAVGEVGTDGPAVQLFLDRLHGGWTLDEDDRAAVRQICLDLDGLPLAVELAAARSSTLPPAEVRAGLADRFALLRGAGPSMTPHHASLLTAVEWSYRLLTEAEQEQFRALAVFDGGFELDAARALLGPAAAAGVADLVAKSLVTVDRTSRPWRYGLLVSLREFAATCTPPDELAAVVRRHLTWAAGLAAEGARELLSGDSARWGERLERERPNLRAAVAAAARSGEQATALALTADLAFFWLRRGHVDEGLAMIALALDATPVAQPGAELLAARARALCNRAHLHQIRGSLVEAVAAAAQSIALAEQVPDLALLAEAFGAQAWSAALLGDVAEADSLARRGLAAAEELGDAVLVAELLVRLGMVRQMTGDWAGAEAGLNRGVEAATAAGNEWTAGAGCWLLAKGALHEGHAASAAAQAADVVLRAARDGNRTLLLLGTLVLAASLPELGRGELAWRLLGAVEGLTDGTGQGPSSVDPTDTPWLTARARSVAVTDSVGELARGRSWDEAALLQVVEQLRSELPTPGC